MRVILYLFLIGLLFTVDSCKKETYTDEEQKDRQKVIDDYNNYIFKNNVFGFYAANEDQLVNCNYGFVSPEVLSKTMAQLNYYRRFVGLSEVTMDTVFNNQCQAVLKYFISNKFPTTLDSNASCYNKEVRDGWLTMLSGSSFYTNQQSAVSYFMHHKDAYATYRRWLMYPKLSKVGYGQLNTHFALKAVGSGTFSNDQKVPEYVAYPPKGFIVQDMLPATWSFVVPGNADVDVRYSEVTLRMRDYYSKPKIRTKELPMVEIAIKVDNRGWFTQGQSGTLGEDPSILFNITDTREMDEYYEDKDLEYEVSIKNVLINGVSKDFNYPVRVIRSMH